MNEDRVYEALTELKMQADSESWIINKALHRITIRQVKDLVFNYLRF